MTRFRIDMTLTDTQEWISSVRAYLEDITKVIPEVRARKHQELKKVAEELGWDYEQFRAEADLLSSEDDLSRVLTYSTIVLLQMIVETQLAALAKQLGKLHKVDLRLNEIYGNSVIERSHIYLKKVIRLDLDIKQDPAWKDLTNLAKLRHQIVHRRGCQSLEEKDQRAIEEMLREYPGELSLSGSPQDENSVIEITPALCQRFADSIKGFFNRILDASGLGSPSALVH